MEVVLQALLSYLIGLAAGLRTEALSDKRKRKLYREARSKGEQIGKVEDLRNLKAKLKLAALKAVELPVTSQRPEEEALSSLFTEDEFLDDIAEWLCTWELEEKSELEQVITRQIAEVLRSTGATEERIAHLQSVYFDTVEESIWGEPTLAQWRLSLQISTALKHLRNLEIVIQENEEKTRETVQQEHLSTRQFVSQLSRRFAKVAAYGRGVKNEAVSLHSGLPKHGIRICLAMGRPQPSTHRELCDSYLQHLARKLCNSDCIFLYSGTDAGNLATVFCRKMLTISPPVSDRIYSFISEEYENPAMASEILAETRNTWPFFLGHEVRYAGMTREIRRQQMVEKCDICILMGGYKGVPQFYELCRVLDKPVLPLYFSGGMALDIFRRGAGRQFCKCSLAQRCGEKAFSHLEAINSGQIGTEEKAELTLELINAVRSSHG